MAARSANASGTPPTPDPKRRRFGRRRKKNPDKVGRIAQMRQVFTMTRKNDPSAVWWMALVSLAVVLVSLLAGWYFDQVIYFLILGIPSALLAALIVLSRRAEKAAFAQIEGQPGATGAVLGSLRRGWFYDKEPIAAESGGKVRGMRDLHNAAMIFRAVGRPGVVLISEGPKGPALRLSQAEKRRATRATGDAVPVHLIRVGQGEEEVRLSKLVRTMNKLDKKISKDEAIAVQRRLKAIGSSKPPVPAGVDPRKARVDRKSMRGR
ncbi:MAG: DUF4191 domain-containing protein [Ornithinimicrobium sp.]